jgi:hypothetical protein
MKRMCAFHAARGVRFTWQIPQGARAESLDAAALALLYEAGWRNVGYGIGCLMLVWVLQFVRRPWRPLRVAWNQWRRGGRWAAPPLPSQPPR